MKGEAANPVIAALGRRLRLGVVGGGPGSFIGPVHRTASRLDDRYEVVAAVLSSNPERSAAAGRALGLAEDRAYPDVDALFAGEADRADGIDVLAIMTPKPPAPPGRRPGAGGRLGRDLRQAADHHPRRCGGSGRPGADVRTGLLHDLQLHRLSDGPPGAGDGARRRDRRCPDGAGLLHSSRISPPPPRRSAPAARRGGWIRRRWARAWSWETSAATPITSPASSPDARWSGWPPMSARSSPAGRSTTARWRCCASRAARAGVFWVTNAAAGAEHGLYFRIFGEHGGLEWAQENPKLLAPHAARRAGAPAGPRRAGPGPGGSPGDTGRVRPSRGLPGGVRRAFTPMWPTPSSPAGRARWRIRWRSTSPPWRTVPAASPSSPQPSSPRATMGAWTAVRHRF